MGARPMIAFAAAAAAVFAQAAPARADYSLNALGTVTAGYSNNVLGVPETTTGVAAGDGFSTISPGLLFSQQTPRMVQVVTYQFDALVYARRSEADSFSNRLGWQSLISVSPVSELGLGAGFSNGRINGFSSVTSPNNTPIQDVPRGDEEFITADADQSYSHSITRAWRLQQSLSFSAFKPIGSTTNLGSNYSTDASVGFDHSWEFDSLTGYLRGSYVINGGNAAAGDATRQQVLLGPDVRYLHDFNQVLSGELDAGMVAMASPSDVGNVLLQPVGGATLRYTTDKGSAALSYQRGVEPNLLVGETTSSDVVSLTGGLPIPKLHDWSVSGTVGYRHGRILDVTQGVLNGSSNQILADAALSWRVRGGLTLTGRFETVQQHRTYQMQSLIQDLNETQVTVSATFQYPSRRAAVMPQRNGARVDRSNERQIGGGSSHSDNRGTSRR